MPELPEVETVRRKLEQKIIGKTIKKITIIHKNVFEKQDIKKVIEQINNEKINSIDRKGKWLIYNLDNYYLLSHLRMEGKYLYRNINAPIEKHELVIFNLDNEIELRYKDTRKFGKMYLIKKDKINESPLSKLGYEPWEKELTTAYLKEKLKNKKIPIKTILLDQSIIVGMGNIYADEVLFLSKINPHKKGYELDKEELNKIIKNAKKVLKEAIKQGGTTIRSYTSEEGVDGLFQNNLLVHKRKNEKCLNCNNIIKKDKIGGRSSYYCPNCQK